ncbi:hypothetical protein E2C01_062240 [Portunus trituberculatus]|uniref:Uncharacterized protein n=1 Tax=Portunus trituberculatus TaxID=210409 RepID=A0A5B7H7D1_PORTR|nr:hypothetical protein [Portunus trituberculatus]
MKGTRSMHANKSHNGGIVSSNASSKHMDVAETALWQLIASSAAANMMLAEFPMQSKFKHWCAKHST